MMTTTATMMLQSMSLRYIAIAVVVNVISHPAATAKAEWE